jgi:hypothetical protein
VNDVFDSMKRARKEVMSENAAFGLLAEVMSKFVATQTTGLLFLSRKIFWRQRPS